MAFEAGEEVEVCELVLVSKEQVVHLDQTSLFSHYYAWQDGSAAVALGCGSLYNHSFHPNAAYVKDFDAGLLRIVSLSAIEPGQEIRIDYSCGGARLLWFDPLD